MICVAQADAAASPSSRMRPTSSSKARESTRSASSSSLRQVMIVFHTRRPYHALLVVLALKLRLITFCLRIATHCVLIHHLALIQSTSF